MKSGGFQITRVGHPTSYLEAYQEVLVVHEPALADLEIHQQEPSVLQGHCVGLVNPEAKAIDVFTHLTAKEEGSVSPMCQIDDETGDV